MLVAPPPPPATASRPVAFYDTECFPNYWLLKFRPRGGQAVLLSCHYDVLDWNYTAAVNAQK